MHIACSYIGGWNTKLLLKSLNKCFVVASLNSSNNPAGDLNIIMNFVSSVLSSIKPTQTHECLCEIRGNWAPDYGCNTFQSQLLKLTNLSSIAVACKPLLEYISLHYTRITYAIIQSCTWSASLAAGQFCRHSANNFELCSNNIIVIVRKLLAAVYLNIKTALRSSKSWPGANSKTLVKQFCNIKIIGLCGN